MRVIAGSRRSLPLKTVPGLATRPTTDRIKETLFNILNPYLPGARFLDVFAGSGAIGIEALSRGASFCCFVEQNPQAVSCINENLKKTDFLNASMIIRKDARNLSFLLAKNQAYDIVFMDPPYNRGLEKQVLEKLLDSEAVHADTLYIIEASLETDFSWTAACGLETIREKTYKTNRHIFLKKKTGEE